MNADTLIKALDEATRAPGALELQLAASGKQLQDLGLSWPDRDSLARLLDAMDKAAALLEGYGKYVVGTPVEVEDLRAYFKTAAAICRQGGGASGLADLAEGRRLIDKDRRDRWFEICSTFSDWARKVEGYRPQEIPQATNSQPNPAATEQHPVRAQETGQISTQESEAGPRAIYHLNTAKNKNEQRRIFDALARAGFIADTDPSTGASMLQPFLNSFDAAATEQGRILWRGTSSKGGTAAAPSPRQALDFVALMVGGIQGITPDFARESFPAIFPGLCCSRSTRSRFIERWNREKGSEGHAALQQIVQSQ